MAYRNSETCRTYHANYRVTHRQQRKAHDKRRRRPTTPRMPISPEQRARNRTNAYLLRAYGISLDTYNRMNAEQDGKCAICRKPCSTGQRLSVDHDHRTNKVRQLLCHAHNTGIGKFGDDVALLHAAIAYLVKHHAEPYAHTENDSDEDNETEDSYNAEHYS